VCQERSRKYDLFFAWMSFSAFNPEQITREQARYQKIFQSITNNMPDEIAKVRAMLTNQRSPDGYPILLVHSGPTARALRVMG
jgi:predicted negative regulator of RcsB-dependent stress response